jgi:hypothetical protein
MTDLLTCPRPSTQPFGLVEDVTADTIDLILC